MLIWRVLNAWGREFGDAMSEAEIIDPKARVSKLFLDFVATHRPLAEVRIGTLGGNGHEAALWKEAGIPADHGWQVEHRRRRAKNLIQTGSYTVTPSLERLPMAIVDRGGNAAYLDAFHFDLNGTVEPQAAAIRAALGCVLKPGSVACIAITVADQRRNRSLENFARVQKRARTMFGKTAADAQHTYLLEEQRKLPTTDQGTTFVKPFDPIAGAKRELGLLVTLAEMLKDSIFGVAEVRRYVYVSHGEGHPFRMRTYFIRFDQAGVNWLPEQRRTSLRVKWIAEPPMYLTATGEATPVVEAPREEPAPEKIVTEKTSETFENLKQLVAHGNGKTRRELDALLGELRSSGARTAFLEGRIEFLLGRIAILETMAKEGLVARETLTAVGALLEELGVRLPKMLEEKINESPAVVTAVSRDRTTPSGPRVKLSPIELRLTLLEAGAESVKARRTFIAELAADPAQGKNAQQLQSIWAHTQGKFRPDFSKAYYLSFVSEVLDNNSQDIRRKAAFERIAEFYTRINAQKSLPRVTAQELLAEAWTPRNPRVAHEG